MSSLQLLLLFAALLIATQARRTDTPQQSMESGEMTMDRGSEENEDGLRLRSTGMPDSDDQDRPQPPRCRRPFRPARRPEEGSDETSGMFASSEEEDDESMLGRRRMQCELPPPPCPRCCHQRGGGRRPKPPRPSGRPRPQRTSDMPENDMEMDESESREERPGNSRPPPPPRPSRFPFQRPFRGGRGFSRGPPPHRPPPPPAHCPPPRRPQGGARGTTPSTRPDDEALMTSSGERESPENSHEEEGNTKGGRMMKQKMREHTCEMRQFECRLNHLEGLVVDVFSQLHRYQDKVRRRHRGYTRGGTSQRPQRMTQRPARTTPQQDED